MQSFKQRYIMLHAAPYQIEQKDKDGNVTGINEGISAYFIYDENLLPVKEEIGTGDRQQVLFGKKPAKQTVPYSALGKINQVPGVYDVTLRMVTKRVQQYGNTTEIPTPEIVDLDYVSQGLAF